jgi:hypothetical protein
MRVIIVINKKTGKISGYSSLETFFEVFPDYQGQKSSFDYYLSRKKVYFEDEHIRLYRVPIKGRKKKKKKTIE